MTHSVHTLLADDGETLQVSVAGQGRPLVLLHGWTASHAAWAPLMASLVRTHQVIRPDARGHGGHVLSRTNTPDVARLARDLLNLLDHFDLERAVVLGHSMGALTLWQFIRDHGCDRLDKLCILDQSPKLMTDANWRHGIYGDFDAARSRQFMAELAQDLPEAVLRLVALGRNAKARETYLRDSKGWRMLREALRPLASEPLIAIWQSLVSADFRDVLPGIDRPSLLVYGRASNFYSDECAEFVASQMAGAVLHQYDEADHCPHLMQPERFLADLQAFLEDR